MILRFCVMFSASALGLSACAVDPPAGPRSVQEQQPAAHMPGDTFKPRLITGDYFLQRQVPDEAAIQLGKDADRQRQLQHKVSRLEERIAEVEGKAPPPASVAPAPEPAASAAPAPEPSGAYDRIRARLQTVDRLHQEGLITQQEYERTRRLILDDL